MSSIATILALLSVTQSFDQTAAYAPVPELNREEIAGIWRLTSRRSFLPAKASPSVPMKEFTVYPKKKKRTSQQDEEETLLMLSEDGSFVQYEQVTAATEDDDDYDDEEVDDDFNPSLPIGSQTNKAVSSILGLGILKGTWDFTDGKLILAADRPSDSDTRLVHDTILIGNVVATSEQSLSEHRITPQNAGSDDHLHSNSDDNQAGFDVHLSVPDGSVEIGRFVYPKHHPSFFEQPIFEPTQTGSFQLRQVLGILNTKVIEKKEIQLFGKKDFYGRTFLLTSLPIQHRPKGKLRWNRQEGKYVRDTPPTDPNEKIDIRVMEIEFFSNNTFSTIPTKGSLKILRGRFNVIGNQKDQLWFQVRRFGFGRSVAGSVFSEGIGLTHDDERAYWGTIREVEGEDGTLEVKGSVLFGWGLEPLPVGRFTMKEMADNDNDEEDEEEDDLFEDMQGVFE